MNKIRYLINISHPKTDMLKLFLISLIIFLGNYVYTWSQCTPPSADKIEDAYVLCSLEELNGYSCSNSHYTNPFGCSPLCPQGGTSTNTQWWAFTSFNTQATFTVTFSNCSVNGAGIQMGLWGDNQCNDIIACNENCSSQGQVSISAMLQKCKVYYFYINGCNGAICDYTISIMTSPRECNANFKRINDDLDRNIPVCAGVTNQEFFINYPDCNCKTVFEWTLDGNVVGNDSNVILLDFPDEGDFQLCVTAYIDNPFSGSTCDQYGPECSTIHVRKETNNHTPKLITNQLLCAFDTSCAEINLDDPQSVKFFRWHTTGGTIITQNPELMNSVCILWNQQNGENGKVCVDYQTDCGQSQTFCKDVMFGLGVKDIAGQNETIRGLSTMLAAEIPTGQWQKISGPGKVNFSNINDPNSKISVSKYGIYVLSWKSQKNDCLMQGLVTLKFIRA